MRGTFIFKMQDAKTGYAHQSWCL